MGAILNRYILRETALTWLAVTGVLLLILLTDQFARVLDDAAKSELPREAIFAVMGLSSLQYLTILMPIGIYLAVILALSRFYRDSEMIAMMACGVGNVALYRPIMLLAVVLAGVVTWLAVTAGPGAQRQVYLIAEEARRSGDLGMLEAGRFISFGNDQATLYAEEVAEDGTLTNVFVERREGDRVAVIVARAASQRTEPDSARKVLTFYDGERYEGVPGSPAFRIMRFREHGIPFELGSGEARELDIEARTVADLLDELTPAAMAELQWRVSVPLTLLVLTLLAVPLSRAQPRQGRYSNLFAAILLYMIYSNLLGASRVWVEKEAIPPWLGLWWVHLVFVALTVLMLLQQNRVFRRLFHRTPVASQTGTDP